MGGLAGLLGFVEPPDRAVVARMSEALAHRGPDAAGAWAAGPAAFAQRLRRVQPGSKVQPLVGDDLVVMLDGWIYDHHELARRAGAEDTPGTTDTEALAQAWRRWGLRLTEHLDGDFAAAIWERQSETLTLFRDRMGVRPLYWARDGARFAFASELPSLVRVPWIGRELARDRLAEFLSFRVVHAPRTLLRDVHQVEPAHWVQVRRDGLSTRCYWKLRYAPVGTARPPEGEALDALQEAVERAVRRRVPPGVPTGVFLSGGLGSTAIAAAARKRGLDLPSFTIAFADDPHPESPFAGRVAKLLRLDHSSLVLGTPELANAFRSTIATLGHPVGNPAAILQMHLARAARERVRVALSGDGGEELFGGRMLDQVAKLLGASGPARLPLALAALVRRLLRRRAVPEPSAERRVLELGIGGTDLFSADERRALLADPGLVRPAVRQDVLRPFYARLNTDIVNTALHGYLRSWLGEGSLVRADRTAAAAGLDIRFPLLDREVVERAAALPGSFKLRRVGGSVHTRWPLRSMVSGVLPPPLVNRPKRGMPTPLDHWLTGPGRLFFEERFAALREDRLGLWRVEALDQLRREVWESTGAGIRLWTLFILDTWLELLDEL